MDWTVETWVRWFAYSSLLAEPPSVWASTSSQVALIARALKSHGVRSGLVLDAGCGTGRITVGLAEYGYEVLGIDISPKFVEEANERIARAGVENKARCVVGDLRRLPEVVKDLRFDAVVSWFSSFGFYGDEVDRAILRNFAWVSKPDALLLLDVENRDSVLRARGFQRSYKWTLEHGDKVMIVNSHYDPWKSMDESEVEVYERGEDGLKKVVTLNLQFRLYSLHELAKLAREGGWKPLEAYGDWSGKPFEPSSPRIVLVAKRA
ncbi:class I SAM-dependent methyltransferase [Ignicoccus hospitalis]|uniref:Methyltransferase type 11 n=1 Tax=Ignicoccus hospitalis (strain KIN4/I / DSM 18386 / JCM 14125) TaxID=453591 RepID=A8ABR8_IGNH4|nr:class I SAM-dependent methyltransferase [Ignicoccus hospitalis]ABU82370.1 Methyltransferase type 11 [Ignicoccus hospitalis KIN4/I]HIH90845.1 class I SAM-dependent methyltransferase [Desulfurococcaceae archaeon]